MRHPPPRLAAAATAASLLLILAAAQILASAVADDAEVGSLADDGLHEVTVNERPNFHRRRRPSRWRASSPEVVAPVDSGATTSQPSVDVADNQGTTSTTPPGGPYRSRSRATRRNSRNRTSNYIPVSRTPQHHYALRGNYEPSTTSESRLTSPLSFSSNTESILVKDTTEGYEHTSNHKIVPSSETAEPVISGNSAIEKQQFSKVFKNRATESPLSIDLSFALRSPEPVEDGQPHVTKSTQPWNPSSVATAFESGRTVPRASGIRSLFGRRFKHRTTFQPEPYRSRSTSQFRTTAEAPLTQTVKLDVHTRATREYEVVETTTPQVDASTPSARRRLVNVARRRRPIDSSTEKEDEGDQRPIARVHKRRRPPTIDTTTDSTVYTTDTRGIIRKTKVYKRRRPVSTSFVTAEPSLLEEDALGNQRGYRRVRPSAPQQESTSQEESTPNREKYQLLSIQRTSKSEETVVGGRRKPGGRVRGRRPLLSHSEPNVGSSEKAIGGEGHRTVLTTTTEILPETASVVPEVPELQATRSTSATTETTTSRRLLSRSRRPFPGFRRTETHSTAPEIQDEPVSHTTPSSLLEGSSTAGSLTTHTAAERDENTTEQPSAGSTFAATTSANNLSSTQVIGDTVSEEGELSQKFSPKFGGAERRLPARRFTIGGKYSKDQRKTTPDPNALGLASGRTKSFALNATGENRTGNVSDRLVKSRTLNSLRNRKPTSLLRRNKVTNVTEVPTVVNKSLLENTVDNENVVALGGESVTLPITTVAESYITTESPPLSTIKGKDRLKKTKVPLIARKTGGPPKLPVLNKIPSNSTEDETNETSTVSDTGTRLKGRKPSSLDKLLKMRRPLPVLLRKPQNDLTSPAPETAERSSTSETASASSTLSAQADVTPGQTIAEQFDTTTATVTTSSLQTNTDDGVSNSIRKLPKGFKPSRFRPTIGEARKTRIKDTPGQSVRDRPRFTPSSIVKGGRVNVSAGNGTQSTGPLKNRLFNNRKPFSGLRPSLLKSTSRFNKKPADSDDEDTEMPTVPVKETTEAYSASPKVVDNVIQHSGSNTTSKVQEMISNRPNVTTEETVTFQEKNTTLGNDVEETLDPLVNPSLSPLEEGGSTTRKTFLFPGARDRGNEKNSKLKSLQKLISVFRQKSTTAKFNAETEHSTPEMPTDLPSDSVDGHPPDHQNTIYQTEISVFKGDDLKTTYTTEESTLTTVMETGGVRVVPEENLIPTEISENYENTFLPISLTTDFTTSSTHENSDFEDNPTVATKIFEADTKTTYPETTTVNSGRLVLKGSDSLDNGNTAMKCLNTSGELALPTGAQLNDDAISLCGNNVSAETTESSPSVTERPDEVLSTLESSTEVQGQSTTTVYEETATLTEPSSTFQMETQSAGSTVSKVWTEPSTEATENPVPESDSPVVSLTDIVLHNLTEAISQLTNEIDSVYTNINVTSEITSETTHQNATDFPNITEQATLASLEVNTSISPGTEDTVLTTETSIATDAVYGETVSQQFNVTPEITTHAYTEERGTTITSTVENTHGAVVKETELPPATAAVPEETTVPSADVVKAETVPRQFNTTFESTTNASTEDPRTTIGNTVENSQRVVVNETELSAVTAAVPEETTAPSADAVNAETVPIQFNTTFETTTDVSTEDPRTTIGNTVENMNSVVVKETEHSTATIAVPEETTMPFADAVNAETMPQHFNTTFESTTKASTEDPRATTVNTVESNYDAVPKETKFPTVTIAVPEETTMPSGLDPEQSIISTEQHKVFMESVPTDKSLATTVVSSFWTGITSQNITEVYQTMVTQTEGPDSKTTVGNLSTESSTVGNLSTESSLVTTEENRSNRGTSMDKSLIGVSDDQSELDSSFSGGSTRTATTVEFRTAGTTITPETSTIALTSEERRDDKGFTQLSTTDDLVTYDNDVYSVTPESDTLNNDNNSSKTKGVQGAARSSDSEEQEENLATKSTNSNTEATVYQSQQPVTNLAVTEPVTERETLEPSTRKTSRVSDSAVSDSNSVLDYEMVTDPVTVITEVFATYSWLTEDGALSTTVQTNTPEENDLKANEINFTDSLYHLPTTQVEDVTLPSQRLSPVNTESSATTTTKSNFHVTGSSINSSEEMASYSSLPDTATTENAFLEDKDTLSSGDSISSDFTDSTVRTVSFSTDSGSQVPEKTTSFTYFGDESTTEKNSVSEDSTLRENYGGSVPFNIQTVTPFSSVVDENTRFHEETTLSPDDDPLLISTGSEDDQTETATVWHRSSASTERTTADYDTTFSPRITVAFPPASETVDDVANADIQFGNTKQTSTEDDDVEKYRDIRRNSMYTDVPTPIFTDSAQPSTPLPPNNCNGQWMEGIQNNCSAKQDTVTGTTEASFIDMDTTKSPSPDSEGNTYQLLITGAATESSTEDGISTYWTESFESEATDNMETREEEHLVSDTKETRDSSFRNSSTDYIKADDESLHEKGNGRFPALDVNTLAPS